MSSVTPESLYYRDEDARRYLCEALVCNCLILVGFVLFIGGELNIWLLALLFNIALVRWMLAVHELFHIRKNITPLVGLYLIPFTPLNVGHEEFRSLHLGHHKNTASDDDPDAFHIRGGHLRSLLGALFFPEGSSLHYLRSRAGGIDWLGVCLRLFLFVALATWGGMQFLLAWLLLRANYLLAIWVFFHHLHYRAGEYGSFPLRLPEVLRKNYSLLYGVPAVQATMHHDVHHSWLRVAAWHLGKLRTALES